ncbi:MAG: tol-pal system protein YbgF [Pelagibacterales bacterium]|nr:tol-pal system protein YbgF [Pelagibacterales bacterium]PPR16934.1 MAG: hypothetical protein CFH33_00310 [Alphaproteobacteria bacterium MarineAlpha9_Bin3]|tara:strand:- start:2168 stop:3196 length:1029 start_codon:yes stop_codon:yes gene_type:complete
MNFKIVYSALSFLTLVFIFINKPYAQSNTEVITNINERILNRIEGLNTKINDLERKVYQGKEVNSSKEIQRENNNYKSEADHERRLLELEEKTRSIEGFMEELDYLKEQIKQLNKQNINLLAKIESLKEPAINDTINKKDEADNEVMEYPVYPGMSNAEKADDSTVKVLAKIDPTNGNDEIIKETINDQSSELLVGQKTENIDESKNISIITPNKKPEEIYQRAYNMLSKGNYEAAEIAFIKFISDFTDHNLASNAYYWLGETFYVRKNYIQAAQNFAAGYKKFPKGSKASAQLLKLGISLFALNKSKEACSTFAKLNKEFTELPLSISNRVNTYKAKLDCK